MVSRNSRTDEEAPSSFIKKLKKTLKPKDYNNFLNTMISFGAQRICTADMLMSINQLLCSDKQLLSQFDCFLPEEYKFSTASPEQQLTWFSVKQASVNFFNKVRTTFDDDKYRAFLSIMSKHWKENYEMMDIKKVHGEVFDLFQDNPPLFLEFTRLLNHQNPQNMRNSGGSSSSGGRKTEKKEKIKCNKNPNTNNDQSKWFEHEDRLFEMDMVIGHLESTIRQSNQFLCDLRNGKIAATEEAVEGYFKVFEIKCIKNVYGARQGECTMKNLRINPVGVLENVLPRLKQKLQESKARHEAFKKKLRRMHESERKKTDISGECGTIYRNK